MPDIQTHQQRQVNQEILSERRKAKTKFMAERVLSVSRDTILVHFRYLDAALSRLKFLPIAVGTYATDGRYFAYSPEYVLGRYMDKKENCARDYLHAVMHCIFHHPFIDEDVVASAWDLACDIAVENAINDFDLPCVDNGRAEEQAKEISRLKQEVGLLTAEKLYRYFLDRELPEYAISEMSKLFASDDHYAWHMPPEKTDDKNANGEIDEESETQEVEEMEEDEAQVASEDEDEEEGEKGDSEGDSSETSEGGDDQLKRPSEDTKDDWQDVSHRTQVGMEAFGKLADSEAGGMHQNLKAVNREKYDYAEFLKSFAILGETMKINDDEFDYIFYTYGLKLYEKMPLIEPLEYKEVKRIKEFVIAIDTSGSTSGDLVQSFLQKTYNVLKSTESFFRKINLHIVQCDADIQESVKVTNQDEFDEYLKKMEIKGLGGTDFRPVFNYVDKLKNAGEFTDLKGLIYFTDGYGTFPERMPDYETAFVFIDDEYTNPEVPPWAIKLVLQREEIQ